MASDDFWSLAKEAFPKLHRAKVDAGLYKDLPQLKSQRQKMFKQKVPPIRLKHCYLNKETNEIVIVEGAKTPVSRFNPAKFEKLFEVAAVEVMPCYQCQKKYA